MLVLISSLIKKIIHCIRSARVWSYSGPYFSTFSRIRTEYGEIRSMRENAGKIGTRNTANTDTF